MIEMVLLSVEACDDRVAGAYLDCYFIGGEHKQFSPPFKPYLYSLTPDRRGVPVKRKLLSNLQERTVWKIEYNRADALERERWDKLEYFPFKIRVAIDAGYKFESPPIKVLAWDIETELTGISPNATKDRIISIATYNGAEGKFFHGDTAQVIKDFLTYVHKDNPDIICDFFGRFYDVPCLMQNCDKLMLQCKLGRDGELPYIEKREFEQKGKGRIEHTCRIKSRLHFDVHKEVEGDYTLTLAGLKSRGLKEVARYHGMNPVEVDYDVLPQLSYEELRDYNISDSKCTYEIGQVYLRTLLSIANLLDLPLDMVVQRNPSMISNIVLGRELGKAGYISDGNNQKRFPQFFMPGKKAVQGAEPKSFRTGVYLNTNEARLKHKDFSSMYVSVMRAFNLSPETVQLISLKPYTGEYNFFVEDNACTVEMPDTINGQVTIRVDLSKKGVMRAFLDDIVAKRKVSKKLWKETKDPRYYSDEIALKLVGNALWGYSSMPYAMYGNVLIGVFCTATPRLLINEAIKKEEAAGNVVLECDTDGIWILEYHPTTFNASDVLPGCFETSLITMSNEDIQGIILLEDIKGEPAAKSYILKEEDGCITKHGSSVLSRSLPLVVDYFVDDLAACLFNEGNYLDVLRKWNENHIKTYPKKAFVQYINLSKRPGSYDPSSMYRNIIDMLKTAGITVGWGDRISYVAGKRDYLPTLLLKSIDEVDFKFYQERMASIASRILSMPQKQILSYMKGDTLLENYLC